MSIAMAESSTGTPHVTDCSVLQSETVFSNDENVDQSDCSAIIVIQPEEFITEDTKKEFKAEYVNVKQEFYSSDTSVMSGLNDIKPQLGLGINDKEHCDQHGFIDIKPQIEIGEVGVEESVEVCFVQPGRRNRKKMKLGQYVQPKAEPIPISMSRSFKFIPGSGMVLNNETVVKQEIKPKIFSDPASNPSSCPVSQKKLKFQKKNDDRRGTQEEERNFTCKVCGEYFRSAHFWAKHMEKQHPEAKWKKCSDCGMEFKKRSTLVRHMKKHREDDGRHHQCDVCGAKYKSLEYVAYHKAQKHGGPLPKKCEKCGERFLTGQQLFYHNREEHNQIDSSKEAIVARCQRNKFQGHPEKCRFCPISFKKRSRLIRHEYFAHTREPEQLKCDFCDTRFKLQERKVCHMAKKHGGPMPYTCVNCGEGFFDMVTLEKHIKNRHVPLRATKNETSSELKCDHKFSGQNEETEEMDIGNSFQEDELKTETPCNAQEESHICSDCEAAFTTELRLLTHACKIPEHVTPQICPICLEGFKFQQEYDNHTAKHTVDDECICLMCTRRFKRALLHAKQTCEISPPSGRC